MNFVDTYIGKTHVHWNVVTSSGTVLDEIRFRGNGSVDYAIGDQSSLTTLVTALRNCVGMPVAFEDDYVEHEELAAFDSKGRTAFVRFLGARRWDADWVRVTVGDDSSRIYVSEAKRLVLTLQGILNHGERRVRGVDLLDM